MAFTLGKTLLILLLTALLLFGAVSCVSVPYSPARIVNGIFSNTFSSIMKRVLSMKVTTKIAMTGRPLMKFEGGYNVETVFDGSKLGVEPYAIEVLPNGDLLILDSVNSNLYRISSSLSLYSRPRLVSGSADGYTGHVDGRLRDARLNHPKGLTVDDKGNIYIADTDNMAIRKISDSGVTTIAGGKRGRGGGGHVDGPSEDAKLSNDFDVIYLGSSCSLLVIDRGSKAIREIQLNFDDCAYQYGSGFPSGIAFLIAAGFFGYMLALLQFRIGSIISPQDDEDVLKEGFVQKPLKSSMRPPLIPNGDEQEESLLRSLGRLVTQIRESAAEILGGVFPIFRKRMPNQVGQQHRYSSSWPVQESFVIPNEDEPPPSIETRPLKKTYAFMSNDSEKMQQLRQGRAFYSGWDADYQKTNKHQHHNQYQSSEPHTFYEESSENTNEIVFGAVQVQDKQQKPMVIKPLNYGIPPYERQNIRSRSSYMNAG